MSAKCIIGKNCSYGKGGGLHKAKVYISSNPIQLELCYKHDLELFKLGQFNFWLKNEKELKGKIDFFGIPNLGGRKDSAMAA
jgi:hypothetical protein